MEQKETITFNKCKQSCYSSHNKTNFILVLQLEDRIPVQQYPQGDTDHEATYAEMSGGQDVVESTYAVVYANTGPSDVPMYDPLIVPTLPISLDDFKHHVSNCHSGNNKDFSEQYEVLLVPM